MKLRTALWGLSLIALCATGAQSRELPKWKPRLMLGIGMVVWSPGGEDKDLFQTSIGFNVAVQYWFKPRTAVVVSGSHASMDAREDVWYDELGVTETFDEWSVEGKLWHAAVQLRQLYPAGSRNFLYLGFGTDLFVFEEIKGEYAIYGLEQPVRETISGDRDPSVTFGPHFSPGMFFLFKSPLGQMFIDVGVKFHYLIDRDSENPFWLDPFFTIGLRLF